MSEGLSARLLGFGHPLLDITATVNDTFLSRFGLKKDSACRGGPEQETLVEDLQKEYTATLTAGGAVQNSIRVAQHVLKDRSRCIFLGSVGDDHFGQLMSDVLKKEGIDEQYVVMSGEKTGLCAVLLTKGGAERSLVAFSHASRSFQPQHVQWNVVSQAAVVYCSGFVVTGNDPIPQQMAQFALTHRQTFAFNLSAPYVCDTQPDRVRKLLPLVDILFCNETELMSLARVFGWQEEELKQVIEKVISLPHLKGNGVTVVVTRGPDPVLFGSKDLFTNKKMIQQEPVVNLHPNQVIDTNGAGDAFAGGFLAQVILSGGEVGNVDNLIQCVKTGIRMAALVVQIPGCEIDRLPLISGTND